VLNLEEDNIGAVMLSEARSYRGDTVKRTRKIASIDWARGLLGRVINTLGEPIDGKGKFPVKGLRCHWNGKLPV